MTYDMQSTRINNNQYLGLNDKQEIPCQYSMTDPTMSYSPANEKDNEIMSQRNVISKSNKNNVYHIFFRKKKSVQEREQISRSRAMELALAYEQNDYKKDELQKNQIIRKKKLSSFLESIQKAEFAAKSAYAKADVNTVKIIGSSMNTTSTTSTDDLSKNINECIKDDNTYPSNSTSIGKKTALTVITTDDSSYGEYDTKNSILITSNVDELTIAETPSPSTNSSFDGENNNPCYFC